MNTATRIFDRGTAVRMCQDVMELLEVYQQGNPGRTARCKSQGQPSSQYFIATCNKDFLRMKHQRNDHLFGGENSCSYLNELYNRHIPFPMCIGSQPRFASNDT